MCAIAADSFVPKDVHVRRASLGSRVAHPGFFRLALKIHEQGITIMMVEQNVKQTLAICDRVCAGKRKVVLEGKAGLLENEKVKQAFSELAGPKSTAGMGFFARVHKKLTRTEGKSLR